MIIPAFLNAFIGGILTKVGVGAITAFAYLWCVRSVTVFFSLTLKPTRKYMALYPVFIFYLFFAFFIVFL